MSDAHYSISTPENVDLHLELAGIGARIWAAFIDTTLLYLFIMLAVLLLILISIGVETLPLERQSKTVLYYVVIGAGILLVFVIQFAYFIYFEKAWNGQTPGKRFAQIRVVEANGQAAGLSAIIIRNLLRLVDTGLMMIGVVFMIFDKKERRLGDMLGGTLVIREKQANISTANLRLSAEAPGANFIDAGQIKPDEYHLLLDFLKRRKGMNKSSRSRLAGDLMEYFKQKLNPENLQATPEEFLEKVYLSYSENSALLSRNSETAE